VPKLLRCPVGLLGLAGLHPGPIIDWVSSRMQAAVASRRAFFSFFFFSALFIFFYLFVSCFLLYLEFLCEYFCFRYKKLQTFC
jgi:hypothetical protein